MTTNASHHSTSHANYSILLLITSIQRCHPASSGARFKHLMTQFLVLLVWLDSVCFGTFFSLRPDDNPKALSRCVPTMLAFCSPLTLDNTRWLLSLNLTTNLWRFSIDCFSSIYFSNFLLTWILWFWNFLILFWFLFLLMIFWSFYFFFLCQIYICLF